MKSLLPLILCALLLITGCSSGTLFRGERRVVVTSTNPTLYRFGADGSVGDPLGTLSRSVGDTLPAFGRLVGGAFSKSYYVLAEKSDTMYVTDGDVLSLDDHALLRQLTKFRLPKAQDPLAWGRATQYVVKHSDMKIQTASDNLIQTYNPIDGAKIGFTITRVPLGDEVEYEVACVSPNMFVDTRGKARRLAYFMVTGTEK